MMDENDAKFHPYQLTKRKPWKLSPSRVFYSHFYAVLPHRDAELITPQADCRAISFSFCHPAICRCNTRSHRPKPQGQQIRRYPRLSPPSIAKESATCLVYQMFAGSTRFACKRTQRAKPRVRLHFFLPGCIPLALCPFHGESLDFSSDFLPLVHRFLFFLACKYGIIP